MRPLPVRCPQPQRHDDDVPLAARLGGTGSRRGVVVAIMALVVVVIAGAAAGALSVGMWSHAEAPTSASYVVQPGDTVFTVASALAGPDHHATELVEWLVESRAGAPLRAGDTITRR